MKIRMIGLILCSMNSALAGPGGGSMDTGGGELLHIRETRIRNLHHGLQTNLTRFIQNVRAEQLPEGELRTRYSRLLDLGLAQDIRDSEYALNSECRDRTGSLVDASAGVNERGGTICFNLPRLVTRTVTDEEFYGLAIHEHAHHLGIRDEAEAMRFGELVGSRVANYYVEHPNAWETESRTDRVRSFTCRDPETDQPVFLGTSDRSVLLTPWRAFEGVPSSLVLRHVGGSLSFYPHQPRSEINGTSIFNGNSIDQGQHGGTQWNANVTLQSNHFYRPVGDRWNTTLQIEICTYGEYACDPLPPVTLPVECVNNSIAD